jgi:aspartyl/asparaginyl beta-hydroxylase (cupin superfamily)
MNIKKIYIIIPLVFILILILILIINKLYFNKLLDQSFYDYKLIYPQLASIHKYKNKINTEIKQLSNNKWIEWPEKYLYNINHNVDLDDSWKIIPLFGFGIWCNEYKIILPSLYKFLKNLKGLKLAIISKLKPFTKLEPHRGWGFHSNNVLRCHYGLVLPSNTSESWIGVMDSIDSIDYPTQSHKLNDWIIFDDSKFHFAVNNSNQERIVLIVDLERPDFVKKGTSQSNSTKELVEFVNEFKKTNIKLHEEIPKEYIELCNNYPS